MPRRSPNPFLAEPPMLGRESGSYCLGTKVNGSPCQMNKERYTQKYQALVDQFESQGSLGPAKDLNDTQVLLLEFCHIHKTQAELLCALVYHFQNDTLPPAGHAASATFSKASLKQQDKLQLYAIKSNVIFLRSEILYAEERLTMNATGHNINLLDGFVAHPRIELTADKDANEHGDSDTSEHDVSENEQPESSRQASSRPRASALRSKSRSGTPAQIQLMPQYTNARLASRASRGVTPVEFLDTPKNQLGHKVDWSDMKKGLKIKSDSNGKKANFSKTQPKPKTSSQAASSGPAQPVSEDVIAALLAPEIERAVRRSVDQVLSELRIPEIGTMMQRADNYYAQLHQYRNTLGDLKEALSGALQTEDEEEYERNA